MAVWLMSPRAPTYAASTSTACHARSARRRRLCSGSAAAARCRAAGYLQSRRLAARSACRCEESGARRVLIDTDPGVDDALAILLALGSQRVSLHGLTIALGNGKDIRDLGSNAKLLLRLSNAAPVPVSLGDDSLATSCEGATVSRKGMEKQLVHGEDNLGNVGAKYGKCDEDYRDFHPLKAPEFIYDVCRRFPGEVSVVCIGPLNNLAEALQQHPDLPELVREVLIMGGAFGLRRGNRTPAAEANFYHAPEAAQAVLTAKFKRVVVAGLDVTHQTEMRELRAACVAASPGSVISQFIWDVCETYMNVYHDWGETVAPAHDVVPIMYLLRPELFEAEEVRVEVETAPAALTRGMSIADWKGQWGKEPNCLVVTQIRDVAAFTAAFVAAMARLPLGVGG
ncbi:unnamed protein product [Durusdinium trenchii]|uniref:Inosine/uridine-preferring nucleoside hydrolase domain-containing protein n=1 Tax=Durusdinium trenchii TaxID=1381693 RepID=A0ABP0LJI3_9DINO